VTYSRASCVVGNASSETWWELVLGFVRFDILQPDLILTSPPTRSESSGKGGCCVDGAFSAFGLEYPEADYSERGKTAVVWKKRGREADGGMWKDRRNGRSGRRRGAKVLNSRAQRIGLRLPKAG
jgi:hypothetical protein